MSDFDEDALNAGLDLIGRAGARAIEFGYLNEDVPMHLADWYAHAQFRGARLTVEHRSGPVEAVEALARRLINGGICTYCGQVMTLSGEPRGGICRWSRQGNQWVRGCAATHAEKTIKVKGPL